MPTVGVRDPALAAFLASDAARNITGQWISVDGGITLRAAP